MAIEPQANLLKLQAVLLTPEHHQAFDALATAFHFELHPTGPLEHGLYTQIVLSAWNIERANRLEAGLAIDVDPILNATHEKTLDRIATFRMRAERTFHKSLKELQAYQAAHPIEKFIPQNKANQIQAPAKLQNEAKSRALAFRKQPHIRPTLKVGRNEHCPCHSGRKFKNCCLQNEANSATRAASPLVLATQSCTGTL